MYGLITRLTANPGQREALTELLVGGLAYRPGCLSYIVALDPQTHDGLWVTEVWMDEAAHKASLAMPETKSFTTRGWPMIATMHDTVVTQPVGGLGLD
ncbi:MAG: antibiotic biosynthesis monooxygenase [Brevundimonas sp.]|nr:MAG: antibiotic biosynthesis monooxygenase [Brevundimonas sp.]